MTMKKRRSAKKKTFIQEGYVILNRWGSPWNNVIYDSEDTASEYIRFFWNKMPPIGEFKFSIVKHEFKLKLAAITSEARNKERRKV